MCPTLHSPPPTSSPASASSSSSSRPLIHPPASPSCSSTHQPPHQHQHQPQQPHQLQERQEPKELQHRQQEEEGVQPNNTPSSTTILFLDRLHALYQHARTQHLCHFAACLYASRYDQTDLALNFPPTHFALPAHSSSSSPSLSSSLSSSSSLSLLLTARVGVASPTLCNCAITPPAARVHAGACITHMVPPCAPPTLASSATNLRDDPLAQHRAKMLAHYNEATHVRIQASIRMLFAAQFERPLLPPPPSSLSSALLLSPLQTRQHDHAHMQTEMQMQDEMQDEMQIQAHRLGCKHYSRRCKLRAKCCGLFVWCRLCHDEMLSDDHEMDRFATDSVLCMVCLTAQPVAQRCIRCCTSFARYFCGLCKFYEHVAGKRIYHCERCGVCRLGSGVGTDMFHCDNCDACIPLHLRQVHHCLRRAIHANCPICSDYLFTSPRRVVFMKCGHTMHELCFKRYTETSYQCPLCLKSIMTMDDYFAQIDRLLQTQIMPAGYAHKRSLVFCNDCRAKSICAYHFLYHKCAALPRRCASYNTVVLRIVDVPQIAQEEGLSALLVHQQRDGNDDRDAGGGVGSGGDEHAMQMHVQMQMRTQDGEMADEQSDRINNNNNGFDDGHVGDLDDDEIGVDNAVHDDDNINDVFYIPVAHELPTV